MESFPKLLQRAEGASMKMCVTAPQDFELQRPRSLQRRSEILAAVWPLPKVVVTVAAQSLAWGKRLHSSSVFPSEVAAVCLVVFGSLFSSLLWCRMETTGLFRANESAIKEHQVSVFSLSDVGDIRVCARLHREPCQGSNRFALFRVLPTLSFLHIFLFPVTSETASRSLSRGWWCSAVSRATLFCRSSPTGTGQSPRSPMSIRLPCCGRQKQVKLAMDVVERKEAMQEKSENDARKRLSCNVKKPEGSNKLKRIALARWCVGMNVDIVNVQSFFFSHFQSCLALLLFSKQGGSRWKRYFCFRLLGWSANVTRLHWSSCQCRYLSNWLDDDVPCTPNGQYSASMTSSSLLH